MSAKLLYNLSEENPNLNKQFGCMNGILQVFYRQHYPARQVAVSGDVDNKSLPQGERRDLVSEINMESNKETEKSTKKKKKFVVAKEKHRVSSESSSRPSFSSSPRSSSFSSAEVSSTTASQFDQPEQPNGGGVVTIPFDLKELVKGSINREMRNRGDETVPFTHQKQPNSARSNVLRSPSRNSNEWKESHRLSYDERLYKKGSKLKETPRLSLDSRSNSFRSPRAEEPVTTSHRRSSSSVVAKLMGLEVIADNFDDTIEKRKENRFCDSPRPMSRVEPIALQRSRSVDSVKRIPMEPAPWKQVKGGDNALTVYGEIQKRLTQLEFKKSGKDLRALKQILEAMEKTQQLMEGSRDDSTLSLMQRAHMPLPAATGPSMNFKSSSVVVMKSAAPVSPSLNVALPNVKVGNSRQTRKVTSGKQNAMDLTPRPGLYKGQLESTKSNSPKTLRSTQDSMTKSGRGQQLSVSPKTQPKKFGFERQSRPTTPKPEPVKRQLGRQQTTELASPRRKQGIKSRNTLQQPDDRLSDASSDLISLRSDSNISLGSNVDIEVTSRQRLDYPELHTPKQRSPDLGIKQDRPSLKPLKVTVEQPSPVSVLDAAFDEDDSPSPVRKISLSFKEDDAGFCRSPENNRGSMQPGSDLLECFPKEGVDFRSGDHKYISEILLSSGIPRDLEYSMISIQLHQTRLPINPGLFFILEQNKASNMPLLDNKYRGRGFRQQQTNLAEKIKRKLVFDTVNEILAKIFTAEACTKPRLTATMEKRSKGEQLLQTLCSEIDRLQQNNSNCILGDDQEDIIWEDLQSQGMNLKEFEGETPGIVLDIERMIFRDLVNEVCFC